MALLLIIDTSTKNCSVILAEDEVELGNRIERNTRSHAQILPIFIKELLEECQKEAKHLDAVVVSAGPGSYTGLRIGMATAKGLCYSLDIPLIALDSLESLADTMRMKKRDENGIYLASLDSRNGEIYFAVMNGRGELICPSQPARVDELNWDKWRNKNIYISGNTKEKLKESKFYCEIPVISTEYEARNYLNLGFKCFIDRKFDDLVYKEPNYLKPFH